jgi:hypothetical protein
VSAIVDTIAEFQTGQCKSVWTNGNFRVARLNVVAGATDASRAMLLTSCRKVELLTAIFGFL